MDVGHQLRVQLVRTDVERGYIDFKRVDLTGENTASNIAVTSGV
jgi:hypothetical protein